MHRRTTTLIALAATSGSLAVAAPASAHGEWRPYRAADFVAAAGDRCPFPLAGDVVRDREEVRTLATYPDGSPRLEAFRGPLVVRYTNRETGRSVVRDLTGRALQRTFPDGATRLRLLGGHFAAGLAPTDAGGPAFLVFTGRGHAVTVAADGSRTVHYGRGPVEDLCDTLA